MNVSRLMLSIERKRMAEQESSSQNRSPLQLTRQVEDLSDTDSLRYRFFCDRCHDPYTATKRSRQEATTSVLLEDILSEAQGQYRQCKQCRQWVCRMSCWDPIQTLCEACSQKPFGISLEPVPEDADPEADGVKPLYSSILGQVCPQCEEDVPENQKVCPECGHHFVG